MNRQEMIKYASELVVKNNPDEAVKLLILYDEVINEIVRYLSISDIPIGYKEYISRVIDRVYQEGENNESN